MPLTLFNLDNLTRMAMTAEIDADVLNRTLYFSPRLSSIGRRDYPRLLREAAIAHDDEWMAQQLCFGNCLNRTEERKTPKGRYVTVRVPVTAAQTLAEGEFNRFYIRGLCVRALAAGVAQLIIYRAKAVEHPRPDSETKLGSAINAAVLLDDLRTHTGVDTVLGLPPGPNSGLSVRQP
jgi:hypothetical protein